MHFSRGQQRRIFPRNTLPTPTPLPSLSLLPPPFSAEAGRGEKHSVEELEKLLKDSRSKVQELHRDKKLAGRVPFKG